MKNSKKKLNNWDVPSTLEEYEQLMRKQSENSSTSEAKKEGQQEATMTYEIRFVSNKKK